MANTLYRVAFKDPTMSPQEIFATTPQAHGEHLIFLDEDGKLVALFLFEIVESWSRLEQGAE